jgi:hypothetical protein
MTDILPVMGWLDEAFCSGVRGPYRIVDRLSELTKTVWETLNEDEKKLYDYAIQVRLGMRPCIPGVDSDEFEEVGNGAVGSSTGASGFPFSPALVCLMEGALAMLKKREFNTDQPQLVSITRFLAQLMTAVYYETQVVPGFMKSFVGKALEVLDPANLTARTAFASVSESEGRKSVDYLRVVMVLLEKYRSDSLSSGGGGGGQNKRSGVLGVGGAEDRLQGGRWKEMIKSGILDAERCGKLLITTSPATLNAVWGSLVEWIESGEVLDSVIVKQLKSYMSLQHPHLKSCFEEYDQIEGSKRLQVLSGVLNRSSFFANLLHADLSGLAKESLSQIVRNYLLASEFEKPVHLPLVARQLLMELECGAGAMGSAITVPATHAAKKTSQRRLVVKLLRMVLDLGMYSTDNMFDVLREIVFRHPFFISKVLDVHCDVSKGVYVLNLCFRAVLAYKLNLSIITKKKKNRYRPAHC